MRSDPVRAVLNPPQLARFRELTGIGNAALEARFDGWSKLALLTDDLVFLFPRDLADALVHGARVSGFLSDLGISWAPQVIQQWHDNGVSSRPFVAFERRTGVQWADVEDVARLDDLCTMLASLGRAIASWHNLDVSSLPPEIAVPPGFDPKPTLSLFLDPATIGDAVSEAADAADASPSARDRWLEEVRPLASLPAVLLHGDVCEGQLLVDDKREVCGVLDWDTAGIGHPLHDLDFGEWGFGIFEWQHEFAALRAALWDAYRMARAGLDLPSADAVHLLFTLSDLVLSTRRQRGAPLDAWGQRRLATLLADLRRA